MNFRSSKILSRTEKVLYATSNMLLVYGLCCLVAWEIEFNKWFWLGRAFFVLYSVWTIKHFANVNNDKLTDEEKQNTRPTFRQRLEDANKELTETKKQKS